MVSTVLRHTMSVLAVCLVAATAEAGDLESIRAGMRAYRAEVGAFRIHYTVETEGIVAGREPATPFETTRRIEALVDGDRFVVADWYGAVYMIDETAPVEIVPVYERVVGSPRGVEGYQDWRGDRRPQNDFSGTHPRDLWMDFSGTPVEALLGRDDAVALPGLEHNGRTLVGWEAPHPRSNTYRQRIWFAPDVAPFPLLMQSGEIGEDGSFFMTSEFEVTAVASVDNGPAYPRAVWRRLVFRHLPIDHHQNDFHTITVFEPGLDVSDDDFVLKPHLDPIYSPPVDTKEGE